jgi:DNA-binding transcriptional ArsR family regulator
MTSTSSRFLVLHALRVKGLASDELVAALSGLPPQEVGRVLADLASDGLVTRREGRFPGSMLTVDGRQAYLPLLAEDVASPTTQAVLEVCYAQFLPLNGEFKRICGDWQVRQDTKAPNDHGDADYDRSVVERLAEVHKQAVAVLAPLADGLRRVGTYPARLAAALERIRSGDNGAFARPMADSYHDIWMELHQDLLLSLQRERSAHDEG